MSHFYRENNSTANLLLLPNPKKVQSNLMSQKNKICFYLYIINKPIYHMLNII